MQKKKNVSGILGQAKGLAARTSDGWGAHGFRHSVRCHNCRSVGWCASPDGRFLTANCLDQDQMQTRRHLLKRRSPATRDASFGRRWCCLGLEPFRSFSNTSSICSGLLTVFNSDAVARFARSRNPFAAARKADDFSQLQEADFLTVLEKIGLINKNVKQELTNCLSLRNACGHPNSYSLGPNKVTAHIEDLILNVFSNFC